MSPQSIASTSVKARRGKSGARQARAARVLLSAEQVSEAVHDLLHQIDPRNHDWVDLLDDDEKVPGLEIEVTDRRSATQEAESPYRSWPVLVFRETSCQVCFSSRDVRDGSCSWHDQPVAQFDYSHPDLLSALFSRLQDFGLKVPACVFTAAKRMQRTLIGQAAAQGESPQA